MGNNEFGKANHALSITTKEKFYKLDIENLKKLRKERRAARILSRSWLNYKQNINKKQVRIEESSLIAQSTLTALSDVKTHKRKGFKGKINSMKYSLKRKKKEKKKS